MKAYLNIHVDNLVLVLPNGLFPVPRIFKQKYGDSCQNDDYLIGNDHILLSKEPRNFSKDEVRIELDLTGLILPKGLSTDYGEIGINVPLPVTRILSITVNDPKSKVACERKLIQTNMVMPKNYLAQLIKIDGKKLKVKEVKSDLFAQPEYIGDYNPTDQLVFDQLLGAYISVKNADLLYAYHFHSIQKDQVNEFYSLSEGAFAFLNQWKIELPKELHAPKFTDYYAALINWMKPEYFDPKTIDNWSDYLLYDLIQKIKTRDKPDFTAILIGWRENETIRQLALKKNIDTEDLVKKLLNAREDIRTGDINFGDLLNMEYLNSDDMFPLRVLMFLDMYGSKEAGNSSNPASRLYIFMDNNFCKNRLEVTKALLISGYYFGHELYANKELTELYPHHPLFLRLFFLNPLDKTFFEKLYHYCFDLIPANNYLKGVLFSESKSSGHFKDDFAIDKSSVGNEFMNLVHYRLRKINYTAFDETVSNVQAKNLKIKNTFTFRYFLVEEFKYTGDMLSQETISNHVIIEILHGWRSYYSGSQHDIKKLGLLRNLLDYYTYG